MLNFFFRINKKPKNPETQKIMLETHYKMLEISEEK